MFQSTKKLLPTFYLSILKLSFTTNGDTKQSEHRKKHTQDVDYDDDDEKETEAII